MNNEWVPFGTHVKPSPRFDHLEFDGVDESGMPLRERPVLKKPTSYQLTILVALNRLGKHVFGGRAARHGRESYRAQRRRNARVARQSRRANRG